MIRYTATTLLVAVATMGGSPAVASDAQTEVLIRQDVAFDACIQTVDAMMERLNPQPGQVIQVAHSSAIYKTKIVSSDANLVFICNDVTEQLEVRRTTPGEWVEARK